MAVTRRSLLSATALFFLLLVCATVYAQTGSEDKTFAGWRMPEIVIMIAIGVDIGITLTRLKFVESQVKDLNEWRVKDHPKEVEARRLEIDDSFRRIHARVDRRSGDDRRSD